MSLVQQLDKLIQFLNRLEVDYLARTPEAEQGIADADEPQTLRLSSKDHLLHQEIRHLRFELESLLVASQQGQNDALLAHKTEQLGNKVEGIARTLILKKQTKIKDKKVSVRQTALYQPDLSSPYQEQIKLQHYEQQLDKQLSDLIDQRAPAYKQAIARERLQRCRDALGLVQIHLGKEKS